MEFTNSIFKNLLGKPRSIKDEINEATKRKKMSFFRREVTEVQDVLKNTGREQKFPALCAVSLFLFAAGCTIAVMLDNIFLIPVLAVGFMFLPFWYVRLTQSHFKKDIAEELETALSIITTAYLRTEDILTAVEENINYLNPPVLSVFKRFVYRIKMINPDITASLQEMRGQIENAEFCEWCDALIACQLDRSLKTTLTPIVSKLSDMRVVNGELENMVFEPRKEFIAMQILVIGNIPLLYFLNKDWYHTLMHTAVGQLVLAVCFTAVFVSSAFVIKLTQPIEYRR
jgi:Flp pilus assembly protein TadB